MSKRKRAHVAQAAGIAVSNEDRREAKIISFIVFFVLVVTPWIIEALT